MTTCDVCGGHGVVTLPVSSDNGGRIFARQYACPECATGTTKAFRVSKRLQREMYNRAPGFREHIRRGLATAIGREMLERGCIDFEEWRAPDQDIGEMVVTAKLSAVLSPAALRKLAAYKLERGEELLRDVPQWDRLPAKERAKRAIKPKPKFSQPQPLGSRELIFDVEEDEGL